MEKKNKNKIKKRKQKKQKREKERKAKQSFHYSSSILFYFPFSLLQISSCSRFISLSCVSFLIELRPLLISVQILSFSLTRTYTGHFRTFRDRLDFSRFTSFRSYFLEVIDIGFKVVLEDILYGFKVESRGNWVSG